MAKFPHVSKFALNKTLLHLAFWDKYLDPHPLPFILKKPCFPQSFKTQNNATKRYSGLPRFSCTLKLKRTERKSQTMGLSPRLDTILITVSTSNNIQYCKKVKYFHFILSHFLSNLIDVIKRNKLISSYFQFR